MKIITYPNSESFSWFILSLFGTNPKARRTSKAWPYRKSFSSMGSGRGGRLGFFLRGRRLRAGTRRLAGAWARRLAVRERRQTFWLRVTQRLGLAHCGMLTLGTHPGPRPEHSSGENGNYRNTVVTKFFWYPDEESEVKEMWNHFISLQQQTSIRPPATCSLYTKPWLTGRSNHTNKFLERPLTILIESLTKSLKVLIDHFVYRVW